MMLFSPPDNVMEKVREAVNRNLEGHPYKAAFIDVIQTGRKTWIEVYLRGSDGQSIIDTREWMKLRDLVIKDLEDEFDQLYVEFIPDLPE